MCVYIFAPTLSAPTGLDSLDPRSGIEHTLPGAIPTANGFPVPTGNNGLFVWNLDPDSPYLITANPALGELGYLSLGGRSSQIAGFSVLDRLMGRQPTFGPPHETGAQWTDVNQYLGSAYFLNQLGLQPESRYRFLGDAWYDTRYITDAILRQTGQRYIGGVGSDLSQMRWLIDNAAQAANGLGLALGVSLSDKQIAQLSHSIVWWEPVTINGQTVLAPKLYLVAADQSNVSGSVISAQHVAITAGDIHNDGGTIKADGMLHMVSRDALINREGLIQAGDNLTVIAKNDIQNLSGTIEGRNVTLQSLDGNVINQTLHQQTHINADGSESRQNANTALSFGVSGITAGIHAKENLGISAANDIQITGAELSAGQNVTLNAGENIDITANETVNLRTGFTTTQGDHRLDIHQQKSHINATDGAVTLTAGDSISVIASDIRANDNITLQAKEDIAILSARDQTSQAKDGKLQHATTDVQSSDIQSGHNLIVNAGNDIVMQASTLNAKDNVLLVAGNDLTLLSDAESRYDRTRINGGYKIEQQVTQQSTEINAGQNVLIGAGNDATLQATQIGAGGDIRLQAEGDLRLLTAEESSYYYEKTKTGGFLSSKSYEEERSSTTHKASELNAGNNIAITSGGDSLYQASKLNAGNDIALTSTGGQIQFSAVENTDFLKVDSKSSSVTTRVAGHGHNNTTQQFGEITQGGELTIQAEKGIRADIRQSSAQSLSAALEQMESAPETAWVAELAVRNDVEWHAVQDAYDDWEYDSESLSPAAAAVIAIVVTVCTAGAGAAAGGAVAGTSTVAAAGATTAAAVSAATAAAVQALAAQATLSLINNQGDVGKVLKDLGSKDNVKSLAASVVAAGVIAGVDTQMGWSQSGKAASTSYTAGSTTEQIATITPVSQPSFDTWWTGNSQLSSWDIAQRTVVHSGISAGVDTAINGSNFLESFGTSLMFNAGNEMGRASSWYIGENAALFGGDGSFGKSVIHGLNGGLIAELTGGDFAAGAGAGFATELASGVIGGFALTPEEQRQVQNGEKLFYVDDNGLARIIGGSVGAIITNTADGANTGANVATIIDQNNRQLHQTEKERLKELAGGDEDKEKQLTAAACALVKCSAEFAEGTAEKAAYEALELAGNRPEYAALREQLSQEKFLVSYTDPLTGERVVQDFAMFQYSNASAILDGAVYANGEYQLTTRGGGLIQATTGAAEIIGGGVACVGVITCAAGVIVASVGFDNLNAGTNTLVSGSPNKTIGAGLLETMGVPAEYSELVYAGVSVAGITTIAVKSVKTGEILNLSITKEGQVTTTAGNVLDTAGMSTSRHPLLDDAIPRNGDRLVVNQGVSPTCGHNTCGMVLDTLGKPVDIIGLISKVPPEAGGITSLQVANILKSEGVSAAAWVNRTVSDLTRYTANGTPIIVRIVDKTGGSSFSHFVVVDGVTTRNGISVVAIRDPWGKQYFSPVSTFEKNFTGDVVVPKGWQK
ncbi:DUF637 domain-containing protein [Limnobaculum parvum]|uniref:Peptidase C39 domain-containing protein n=1 Tax=Limnobaculum parvum TaxID=2172103 RepID=A0A2Y9TYE0_9GAMM|nr:DUF637 domain-containing protein [Limnobaculum parvum]AWH88632.1 hypothetical protein HYN51_08695 [Limnobaculum parvum]